MKSNYANQWFGKVSMQGFVQMIESENRYYGLSRGIFPKYKKDGDGVYNQDLSKNAMLIEVGGIDNTLDELYNTIDVLTEAFSKYYWNNAEKVNG
jgi:stage II sporulation protein P